ncbi:hypothetical protein SCAB_60512 [Streptomyces scabiei 87.22]|uniref:Uncharacterized protein n=1 Tax=Streptomyces scabiei (strain 87.22) TaxID=680198 RepID=C9Z8Y2_STRSW|nr:hypothetical protein SCAB_60512 [Streptomyces scabiei 87.22]
MNQTTGSASTSSADADRTRTEAKAGEERPACAPESLPAPSRSHTTRPASNRSTAAHVEAAVDGKAEEGPCSTASETLPAPDGIPALDPACASARLMLPAGSATREADTNGGETS